MDFKIQWFPGHMTKAKRMMEQQLKLVDVVVEMLDARIPRSSSNPMLIQMLGDKPKVVALNKIDMADPEKTEKWLQTFKNSGLPVCKVDCSTGKGVKQMVAAIQQVARPVTDKWLRKGVRNRSIRVMIVGVPNVGKSTLINRLVGKNKVVAADRPGVTRGQQWVTIAKGLELLDTPGVLWPKFEDP
ncbi:ribosome biogenesis GTPase YlqF, partial [Phascolarctobacterium faecium]